MALYHLHDAEEYIRLSDEEWPMFMGISPPGDLIDYSL